MAERQSLGRKKIEIAKIQNPTHLQVTFSKRRAGIFKKASELSILCGVEVALIIFSPGKKVFTFGHPSMETVVEDFLGHDNQPPPPVNLAQQIDQMIEASQYDRVSALIMQLRGLEAMREDQKKKGENIDRIAKENVEAQGWMRGPYNELNLQQLATLKKGMEVLLKDLHQKAQQLVMEQVHGDGGGGGDVGGSAAASAFPINAAYTPSGIMIFPPGGGGGDGDVGVGGGADVGGSATASAFPINAAYTPRGIMVFPPGGGGGGGAANSGFPDNAYTPSGAMVFPPGGGGGVGGGTAASGFPTKAYMPSGGMVFPLGGGSGAAADSGLPDNAYMPSGGTVFPPGGGGGTADSGLPDNAYMPSSGMIFPPGGSGGVGGGAAASVFPVDAYMPGGFNDASTSGASGSGANLGNDPEFF